MIEIADLPAVNATLNGLSALLLIGGYTQIKRGRQDLHKRFMVAALVTSALFLACYLVYHYHIGSKPFLGTGPVRIVYFTILISHVILAAAIVPLIIMTALRAFREDFTRHVAIARWTFPLWMYVSVTGVIVYLMLY